MVRTKNKRKEGGQGPSSKLEEDPILTTELARSAKDSHEGGTKASFSPPIRHMVIDGRSLAVMFDDGDEAANAVDTDTLEVLSEDSDQGTEGDPLEKYSDDTSQPLGDGDPASTQCVRQNAQEDFVNPQSKPSAAAGDRNKDNGSQDKKKSYVSLFARNRLPSTGSKLDFFNLEDGPIPIEKEEIQLSDWPWERCLVGYFGGRFPGKCALNQIIASWKVHPTIIFHGSGWIVFQFSSIEDQDAVLDNGLYMIYGCPLLLKSMDKYFNFGKEEISTFPAKPIHMDKLTTQKERVTYARCLVEIDMAKKLVHSVDLLLPEGGVHQQMIYYENLPKYCPLCKVVGHTKENCKSITKPTNKAAEPNIASSDQGPRGAAGQPSAVAISSLTMEIIPVNHEPNKESILEPNPEPISEIQSLLIELNPNGVLKHLKKIRPVIMGLIETKLSTQSLERLSRNKLYGWKMVDNFNRHPNGWILVIWKEELVALVILETSDQAIHCQASLGRRSLWDNLRRFNSIHHHPWILLGDFNNVLSNGERINGMPVTTYEIREFKECCYDLGLSDLRSIGTFFTWTNNSVWCKLDRVMVNNEWTQRGMLAQAQYDPSRETLGPLSITITFRQWYVALGIYMWREQTMFRLCKKLKTLKDPLKSLNKLHFSHISTRSAAAEEDLQQAQQQLHNNPNDSELQAAIPILRAKALKLAEAEMSFCSQIAKAKFLKNTNKGTKFFHNMIKSKRTRNNIPFISLLKMDPDQHQASRILDQSQSLALVLPVTEEEIKNALFSIGVDKAPGPNGYSSLFFKQAWDIVGRDVTDAVLEFFFLGPNPKSLNHSADSKNQRHRQAGICDLDLERIKEISGFPQGSFPFRYLGIPVADSRLTISQYSPLIDRISDSISAWAGAILSYAGRTELIKNFLWSGKCTINKKPLVAWKEVTLPKIEGGLGLRNPKAWNKALLSKTLWDIQAKKGFFMGSMGPPETVERASLTLHQWALNGKFQSRLAYEFLRPKNAKLTWPKLVWHATIISRHSFILWLGLKDRLLTKNKLRDYIEDQSCPLCSAQNETLNHLFFQCTFGKQIWANIKSWLGISRAMQSLKATVKWLIKEACGTGFPAKNQKNWHSMHAGDYPVAPRPWSSFSSLVPDVVAVLKLLLLMLNSSAAALDLSLESRCWLAVFAEAVAWFPKSASDIKFLLLLFLAGYVVMLKFCCFIFVGHVSSSNVG
ncbi:hypothetical protein Acr_00g0067560 [Actinidia rufa]|uniref:Reverse transcriptase zinc-binding domain-containing protein n=1 Tax=Actinidia rufa TaxID=165716 RepID=A0A7J0DQN3_9ERIC|nr:hypothetical protein Acr_00g0067560 [Actinidia rufa]